MPATPERNINVQPMHETSAIAEAGEGLRQRRYCRGWGRVRCTLLPLLKPVTTRTNQRTLEGKMYTKPLFSSNSCYPQEFSQALAEAIRELEEFACSVELGRVPPLDSKKKKALHPETRSSIQLGRPSEGAVHPPTEKTPGGTEITIEGQVQSNKIIGYNGHMAENDKEIGYGEWMLVSRKNLYVNGPMAQAIDFRIRPQKQIKPTTIPDLGRKKPHIKGKCQEKRVQPIPHGAKQIQKNGAASTSKNSNTQSGSRFAP
ncbi:hypothetical protein RHMOL_Rhmol04G0234100 [Rhododendron molle]|uniref:Uncharacterized protein n=1 Tax=Rhododendron molle TaxID=49168 RepID=A0ACC0P3P0_RHOML|nr:hypothetical protein RHMOL_Rhmol04G0234100 [Rhododendron molle]